MIEALQNFHFIRPAALGLALPALIIWWLWRKHADPLRGWRSQIDAELLDALADGTGSKPRAFWPLLIAWLISAIAVAGPSWKPEPSPFAEDISPLIILFKADTSMDTPDPEPSRLERAHLKIADLAKARKGQPLGLITYAGSAHLVLPPTKDTDVVATMAAEISPEIMPGPGDRLDLAFEKARELLKKDGGTILIVTDTSSSATPEIKKSFTDASSPDTQILAISPVGSPPTPLEALTRMLDADLVAMSDDDQDIERIVKGAARPPVARAEDGSTRWQDGGYYLVPFLAVFALLPFRRESQSMETA
jgi:Ca-activated chloride channel family protein